jgi:hypothetical protein
MKTINKFNNLKVTPVISDAAMEYQKVEQIRNIVENKHFFTLTKELPISQIEIIMSVTKARKNDTLKLHIFGSNGEYILTPYTILYKNPTFISSPIDKNDLLIKTKSPFLVSKIGFSSDKDEMIISFSANEV